MSKKQKLQQTLIANPEANASRELLEQAEVCCREARLAARMKRLRAACGLFQTAMSLLRRASEMGGAARQEATERLAQIGNEAAVYAELCRDKTLRSSPKSVPVRVRTVRKP